MPYKFDLYKDAKGEFRWRLVAPNGQSIATVERATSRRKAPRQA